MSGTVIPPTSDVAAWVSRAEHAVLAELVLDLPRDLDHADPAVLSELHRRFGLTVGDLWPFEGPQRVRFALRRTCEIRRHRALRDLTIPQTRPAGPARRDHE